ncbi:DUF6246 family protein [Enterobacter sp.]|uniref:DUF6246 family protein n=1 Tax=Enterobacter sp. TaxID=42895 RepID=UPI00296FCA06|nr:DUF6246 family protein [Enterobacter sp.]
MTPYKEIGECLITSGEDEYFFRPSLAAMSRIGEPQEIVQCFYDLHNDEVTPIINRAVATYGALPQWLINQIHKTDYGRRARNAAMSVLTACCDADVSKLIGEDVPGKTGRKTFLYKPGEMELFSMIVVAQSLITHGIIGKAKVRQLQRHESNQAVTEFRVFEYINAARNHFGMSRQEAEQLSMTEFQMMLAAKYPDQKGFTREEYDQVADEYLARKAKKLAKAA